MFVMANGNQSGLLRFLIKFSGDSPMKSRFFYDQYTMIFSGEIHETKMPKFPDHGKLANSPRAKGQVYPTIMEETLTKPNLGISIEKWGYPQKRWMVFVSENPNLKWMMTGGTTMTQETSIWDSQ